MKVCFNCTFALLQGKTLNGQEIQEIRSSLFPGHHKHQLYIRDIRNLANLIVLHACIHTLGWHVVAAVDKTQAAKANPTWQDLERRCLNYSALCIKHLQILSERREILSARLPNSVCDQSI